MFHSTPYDIFSMANIPTTIKFLNNSSCWWLWVIQNMKPQVFFQTSWRVQNCKMKIHSNKLKFTSKSKLLSVRILQFTRKLKSRIFKKEVCVLNTKIEIRRLTNHASNKHSHCIVRCAQSKICKFDNQTSQCIDLDCLSSTSARLQIAYLSLRLTHSH